MGRFNYDLACYVGFVIFFRTLAKNVYLAVETDGRFRRKKYKRASLADNNIYT